MTEFFDSGYAKQFLAKNSEVVTSWEKSSEPVRSAIAVLLKQTAGEIAAM